MNRLAPTELPDFHALRHDVDVRVQRHTRRRQRRAISSLAITLLAFIGGLVIAHVHHTSAPPRVASPVPVVLSGHGWQVTTRASVSAAPLICQDFHRDGIEPNSAALISACTSGDSSLASYHWGYVDLDRGQAVVAFGRAPAGTTHVEVRGATGDPVIAQLVTDPSLGIEVWAAEVSGPPTAATATGTTTVDLIEHQMVPCPGARTDTQEVPRLKDCPGVSL